MQPALSVDESIEHRLATMFTVLSRPRPATPYLVLREGTL
jgi:hypothetical protein